LVENRRRRRDAGQRDGRQESADGYTLVVADNARTPSRPRCTGAKLTYDVFKDFTPITLAAKFPTVIMIHPSVPAQSARSSSRWRRASPGQATYSSAGTGNGSHLTVSCSAPRRAGSRW